MRKLTLLLSLLLVTPLYAVDQAELDAREARLAAQLRCVVCQNQTVAESNAPLAADMRTEIRKQLENGSSDQQVIDFFEQRYGSFVHYLPPFRPATWLLWGAPFLFGLCGLFLLFRVLRRRSREPHATPLTEEQRAQARRLLHEDAQP
ncbi:cytochrome c-type biogenesis protein [Herminiimonas contaminans]|uniref:Cytochrome c-type biogenesis protein n=1 Tax=Herminiimonas contaminans TaxID=1111140 RepID=A0ABS0EV99_9BURK|nr:cytochrome c-type biogenesis protein [Herminiimonas contaminans]MBF8178771.1 cytochrome c-type biogenesis protein CcmH [Herminiimonas contaminans]